MLDENHLTGSIPSPADMSILVIVKMFARLLLLVIREQLAIKITPRARVWLPLDPYLVECGELALHIRISASAASQSPSKRRTRKPRSVEAVSSSTEIILPAMAVPPADASSSTLQHVSSSNVQELPRGLEP